MKPRNPFIIKGYQGPEYFCDRRDETQRLISAIENGRDVTLMAPRRYGKTGLIKNVFDQISGDYATIYLDIYSVQDLPSFVSQFSSAVLKTLDGRLAHFGREFVRFFRSCRPTMTPQGDGTVEFSFDVTSANAAMTMEDTFKYLQSCGRACVIAIDEFQQVREFPEKGVEALLRKYIQFLDKAHFIFAGSKKHLMEEMFTTARGPFYQSTQIMSLDVIERTHYRSFAEHFFTAQHRPFKAVAFNHLYDLFEGITWYVQAVLNRVWAEGGGCVTPADVDEAVDVLVAENALVYRDLLMSQSTAERALLQAIAREGRVKGISGKGFIERHRLPAASTIRSAASALIKRELLYSDANGVIVYDRIFARWLARAGVSA